MTMLAFDIFCFILPSPCLFWKIPPTAEYFPIVSEDEENPEECDSTSNVGSCAEVAEDSEASKEENNIPSDPEAPPANHKNLDDKLTDTVELNHDNDVYHAPFVHAAPERPSAQPSNRPSGGSPTRMIRFLICKFFLLLLKLICIPFCHSELFTCSEEGFTEPPLKKAKASACKATPAASETPAPPKVAPPTSSLSKGKEVPSAVVASPSPRGEFVIISTFSFP
jgi:hypothetical protein